jgi:hypothetical protein
MGYPEAEKFPRKSPKKSPGNWIYRDIFGYLRIS